MSTAAKPSVQLPERPYPGIESFRYVDAPIFFERDEESERLHRLIIIYRGVLLYGGQGTGKSSLVNAGFLPLAVAEGYVADRLRLQPEPGREVVVERISVSDDGKPPFLPSAFASDDQSSRVVLAAADLPRLLRERTNPGYPLLVFDQFEEFVTLFEEAPRGDARARAAEAQQNLTRAIVELVRDHRLRVKVLFSFREDYLAKLHKLFDQCQDLMDVTLRLTPVNQKALVQIIRGPFDRYPGHYPREISPTMAQKLADAIAQRSESGEVNLSEMQIACSRLWSAPDPEAVFAQKGMQGLLEESLEEALRRTGRLRDPAVALLGRMVTDEGLRNVVSRQDLIQRVSHEDGFKQAHVSDGLDALEKETGLVRRERRQDVVFYTIVSEFLVPWIGRQKAIRASRALRKKWLRIGAVVLLLFFGAMMYLSSSQAQKALQNAFVQRAHADAEQARQSESRALAMSKAAEQERTHALEQLAETNKQLNSSQAQVLDLSKKVDAKEGELRAMRYQNPLGQLKLPPALRTEPAKILPVVDSAEAIQLRQQVATLTGQLAAINKELKDQQENMQKVIAVRNDYAQRVSQLVSASSSVTSMIAQRSAKAEAALPGCANPETEVLSDHTIRHLRVAGTDLYLFLYSTAIFSDKAKAYLIRSDDRQWASIGLDAKDRGASMLRTLKEASNAILTPNTFVADDLSSKDRNPLEAKLPEGTAIRVTLSKLKGGAPNSALFEVCQP